VKRPTFICGGDTRPGTRGTDCPNVAHDHPLPDGYVDASDVAQHRLATGWSNRRCPDCDLHGWFPPAVTDDEGTDQ
jgi:hypothetical protein